MNRKRTTARDDLGYHVSTVIDDAANEARGRSSGCTATFSGKDAGTRTVTLAGATLSGAAARNYVLDSIATTSATITPKALTGCVAALPVINAEMNGPLPFLIDVSRSGIVDGQSVARLLDGALFTLTVGKLTYSVRAQAIAIGNIVAVGFRMTAELTAILAANTAATNGGKATAVVLTLTSMSRDGNYTLGVTATTKLFNTSK